MPCIPLHPLLDIVQCIYIEGRCTPSQSSIDALHTTTPTARSRTMHTYRRQMDPPVNWAQMPYIPLHLLLDIVQCLYIEDRWTPQSIDTDALHTTTHTARCSTMHIYRRQMDLPVNWAEIPCIPLHPLLDLDPLPTDHRCLPYHYIQC